jgi:hypothetical protein
MFNQRLVAGFPPLRSGQVGFVMDKVALGQVSPSTSVSPANLHSIKFSTTITSD